jgi:hypothetical protein
MYDCSDPFIINIINDILQSNHKIKENIYISFQNMLNEHYDSIISIIYKLKTNSKNVKTFSCCFTKKQLSQAKLIISQIKKETDSIKLDLLTKDYNDTKTELNQKFEIATTTLKNRERLILTEIKQNLSFLALKQVVAKLENEQESGNWTKRYVDENIEALKNLNLKNFKK